MTWQLLGYMALACYLGTTLFKNPRHYLKLNFLGESFNITLYLLTGQVTGALVMALNTMRIMAALRLDVRQLRYTLLGCAVGI